MKPLLMAVALLGAIYFLVIQDDKSVFGKNGITMLGDSRPSFGKSAPPPPTEAEVMASQIETIAQYLNTNPLVYSGLIVNAIESCLPKDTPFYIAATLAKFVRISAENTLLPADQQAANLEAKLLKLNTDFETWLTTLHELERAPAIQVFENQMANPAAIFNCNASWLLQAER